MPPVHTQPTTTGVPLPTGASQYQPNAFYYPDGDFIAWDAGFLKQGRETPVIVRSTVLGSRGAAATVRDTRGFATKFYPGEGTFALVGLYDAIEAGAYPEWERGLQA